MAGEEQTPDNNTPLPTTEAETPTATVVNDHVKSSVTDNEWRAMLGLLNYVYDYRKADGHDPSKVFHRKVNKRVLPSYYDVIEEPMAMSTIKAKINTREYQSFAEFVRDFALIPHNAQVYNRPDAGAYQDALDIKKILEDELQKFVDEKLVTEDVAKLPYLGEIPEPDPLPAADEEEEEEEEEEDGEESDDSRTQKKRGRGRPKGSTNARREEMREEALKLAEADANKKRGRPPRVDTPMEARIKNILKGMRRLRSASGELKITHFERLPDRAAMPEYFQSIRQPMAVDVLKKKAKRKKYITVEQFMRDVELMFENAKQYNTDDSEIYKDAVELQTEVRKLAEEEQKRPDTDFAMEDGRLPLPDGILHNGELYKVGDWVHIQNANDLTKPIITQIYRTWQDASGQKFVNACWYYRPEQTVHRFDKHFYENEVVKTGQYRDHSIEEVVDRCFVMFFTRFSKGRPRNFPPDKEVYVCEARYNEEKHTLNKIKTWASCLPDEVRDKDYEMDPFPEPKRMRKRPSPIAYTLKEDAKETDDLPKPEWGADNAPPKIGAVHKRPRDPKDSPPPEPTPSPPPVDGTPSIVRQTPMQSVPTPNMQFSNAQNANYALPIQRPPLPVGQSPHTAPPPNGMPHTQRQFPPQITPAPLGNQQTPMRPINYGAQPLQQPNYLHQPQSYMQPTPPIPQHYSNAQRYHSTPQQMPLPQHSYASNYRPPPPTEVWHLDNVSNASVPPHIRSQFKCDEQGRILFFTAPPVDSAPLSKTDPTLGHSAKFIAGRAKREALKAEYKKKKAERELQAAEERQKTATLKRKALEEQVHEIAASAVQIWEHRMAEMTEKEYRRQFGDNWADRLEGDLERFKQKQIDNGRGDGDPRASKMKKISQ